VSPAGMASVKAELEGLKALKSSAEQAQQQEILRLRAEKEEAAAKVSKQQESMAQLEEERLKKEEAARHLAEQLKVSEGLGFRFKVYGTLPSSSRSVRV
jgi:hypothetical protein